MTENFNTERMVVETEDAPLVAGTKEMLEYPEETIKTPLDTVEAAVDPGNISSGFTFSSYKPTDEPLGVQVRMKTPLVPSRDTPLFVVMANPCVLNPIITTYTDKASTIYKESLPVFVGSRKQNAEQNFMEIQVISPPGSISMLATTHRYWSGTLMAYFRLASCQVEKGLLEYGVLRHTAVSPGESDDVSTIKALPMRGDLLRDMSKLEFYPMNISQGSVQEVELTMGDRVPFDQCCWMMERMDESATTTSTDFNTMIPVAQTLPSVVVRASSTVGIAGGSAGELVIQVWFGAGPDFAVYEPLLVPSYWLAKTAVQLPEPLRFGARPGTTEYDENNKKLKE